MRKYLRALHSNLCKDDVLHSDVYMLLEYPNSLEQALFLFHKILGILDRAIEFLVWLPGGHIPGDGLRKAPQESVTAGIFNPSAPYVFALRI